LTAAIQFYPGVSVSLPSSDHASVIKNPLGYTVSYAYSMTISNASVA